MGKTKARLLAKWAEREAELQRMLGVETSDERPVEEVVVVAETEVAEAVEAAVGEAAPPEPAERPRPPRNRRPAPPPTDVKPYQVACPRCAAHVGAPCRTGAGKPVRPHTDRLRQAALAAAIPAPADRPAPGTAADDAAAHFFETARERPAEH
ncbi:hypothetical protein GCM10022221_47200 [Actinocorallia aurea]